MTAPETAAIVALVYLGTAAVSSLPRPGTPFDWYAYLYHILHQCLNAVPQQYRTVRPGDPAASQQQETKPDPQPPSP